jgi:hypothetical protein
LPKDHLSDLYSGPFTVDRVIDEYNIAIKRSSRGRFIVVHRNKLKRVLQALDVKRDEKGQEPLGFGGRCIGVRDDVTNGASPDIRMADAEGERDPKTELRMKVSKGPESNEKDSIPVCARSTPPPSPQPGRRAPNRPQ